jgi:succinate dehydrogenase / fumarate reductase membrane anchor subunit
MSVPIFRRPKPTGRLELYAWFFMRFSGIVLILLVLGHLVLVHLISNVGTIDYHFVAARYQTPFWRYYDLLMVILAMLHGANGAKIIIDDYVHPRGWRILSLSTLYLVTLVFLIVGTATILVFRGG